MYDFYVSYFVIKRMLIKTNIRIKGKRRTNQAIPGAPARQIKFKIHVQNRMYTALIIKIRAVLDTVQDNVPTQYVLILPTFWYNITTNAIAEITK